MQLFRNIIILNLAYLSAARPPLYPSSRIATVAFCVCGSSKASIYLTHTTHIVENYSNCITISKVT